MGGQRKVQGLDDRKVNQADGDLDEAIKQAEERASGVTLFER